MQKISRWLSTKYNRIIFCGHPVPRGMEWQEKFHTAWDGHVSTFDWRWYLWRSWSIAVQHWTQWNTIGGDETDITYKISYAAFSYFPRDHALEEVNALETIILAILISCGHTVDGKILHHVRYTNLVHDGAELLPSTIVPSVWGGGRALPCWHGKLWLLHDQTMLLTVFFFCDRRNHRWMSLYQNGFMRCSSISKARIPHAKSVYRYINIILLEQHVCISTFVVYEHVPNMVFISSNITGPAAWVQ